MKTHPLHHSSIKWQPCTVVLLLFTLIGCARMGQPDGGWFDETPPKVVKTYPIDKDTNVNARKVYIAFDEYIKVDNPSENVVISPPQILPPDIKTVGRRIEVTINDSLKPNTTYTIDFSSAISDNNEGNPLGNYTYSFSTGSRIDTLEVSGNVVEAENMEPIKGILVGLYADTTDTAFVKHPMLRVAKTDSRGHFVIKGIAPGSYRIYALQDQDGNYAYTQKSEKIAFDKTLITPYSRPDIRQDTLWRDSLHIDSITRVGYTHFYPDDLVLRAFAAKHQDRFFLKATREAPESFTLYFSGADKTLPHIKGLNFDATQAFVIESSAEKDSVTYWLKDTLLVNQDTLRMELTYNKSDSTGMLVSQTDTLEVLSKISFEKRMKDQQKAYESWQKEQEKLKKDEKPYQTEMPPVFLTPDVKVSARLDADKNIAITLNTPPETIDRSKIHLYASPDSVWYEVRYALRLFDKKTGKPALNDSIGHGRDLIFMAEWKPGLKYSLEIDSAAVYDIYGHCNPKIKKGFVVPEQKEYGSFFVSIPEGAGKWLMVQLLDGGDKIVKQISTFDGNANFYYVAPGKYYLRYYEDDNHNEQWDTGSFETQQQAEKVVYYPDEIECKANWDVPLTWKTMTDNKQPLKPSALLKQKAEKEKTIQRRNFERAQKLGIPYPNRRVAR